MTRDEAFKYRQKMVAGAQLLPDAAALEVPLLFERWAEGIDYSIGDRICYEEVLYRCVQAHRSQSDWMNRYFRGRSLCGIEEFAFLK